MTFFQTFYAKKSQIFIENLKKDFNRNIKRWFNEDLSLTRFTVYEEKLSAINKLYI